MSFNLSSISTGPNITPPRLVVYGPHGLGKTTLIAEAPSPILLPTEDGKGTLSVHSFPVAKSYADVCEAIGTLLNDKHEYATFGLDTIDWLEPLIWRETCARNNWADIEQPGYGKGYTAAADVWREFYQGLVALRDERGMQVILTAHTQVKSFNDPQNDPYDRYQIKLQDRASAITQEWADGVLFLNQKNYTSKSDKGFKKIVTRGISMGERVLYTEERASHLAKNRYGLPAEIGLPKGASYATLAKHLFPTAN